VLRDLQIWNGNVLSGALLWTLEDVTTLAVILGHQFNVGDLADWRWEGRIVIDYPSEVQWTSSTTIGASGVDVYLGGYAFALP
jgi:hypothetical protein